MDLLSYCPVSRPTWRTRCMCTVLFASLNVWWNKRSEGRFHSRKRLWERLERSIFQFISAVVLCPSLICSSSRNTCQRRAGDTRRSCWTSSASPHFSHSSGHEFFIRTVLVLAHVLPPLWLSLCPDLLPSPASWTTTPSSCAARWTCTRPRSRRPGCSGPRSCSCGRTSCSGTSRAEDTSTATPETRPCCCSSKRVRRGCTHCHKSLEVTGKIKAKKKKWNSNKK